MATPVLADAEVTVARSVFKLIDASTGIRLFSIHIKLNSVKLKKKNKRRFSIFTECG